MIVAAIPFLPGVGLSELIILCGCVTVPLVAIILAIGLSRRSRPDAAPAVAPSAAAGWLPDPMGRHQYRYWDGVAWTQSVSDDGVQSVDPL